MKWIVIAIFALTTPVLAMSLSHRHCVEIEVEIRRAVDEGYLPQDIADSLIIRCYKSKDWTDDSSKVHQTDEKSGTSNVSQTSTEGA